jgi:hypothetical protein
MSYVPVSVALGVIATLVANPSVWTAKLEGKDGSKITGTARVESAATVTTTPRDSAMPPRDTTMRDTTAQRDNMTTTTTGAGDLRVTINVSNAPQNTTLLWSIREGECDHKGTEVKVVSGATGNITVDAQGNGTATSQVKATLPANADDLHVAVYGRQEAGKLAACGELEAAKTSTEN